MMRKKIFLNMLLIVSAAVILTTGLIAAALYDTSIKRVNALNRVDALAIACSLNVGENIDSFLEIAAKSGVRVTIVSADGSVYRDNAADTGKMENHLSREEFQMALKSGEGWARRASTTLGEQYAYYAVRLDDGGIVRVARAQRTVLGLLSDMRLALVAVAACVLALSAVMSLSTSRRIVAPLLALNLDRPDENVVYEELTPLLTRIAAQNERLNAQLREMGVRQNQLSEIMNNMSEGLIILDRNGRALSVNVSAKRLLEIGTEECAGRHLYELSRDVKLQELYQIARDGQEAESVTALSARALEMRIAPVHSEDGIQGYVLLIVDITQKRDEEKTRREFTANVSHELKTPLTSISGYAEIMQNGMAREEDMRAFAGKIYRESQRLIALIQDIMRLSKLDEGDVRLPFESVALRDVAMEAAEALRMTAENRRVSVSVEGEGATVRVVRQLAFEILYNLIDNAVRYNFEGGSVRIELDGARVRVIDNGIGIAPIDQEKVFQRFYRADKSHSKQTGGTGLGLSIVKHAAEYLGARIELTSREGEGTCVTVRFAG